MIEKTQISAKINTALHFKKFREGNEKGLAFFYQLWYARLYYRGLKYIKDDVNASCIVNEAFLRLWLFRSKITEVEQMVSFMKKVTSDGYRAYFKTGNQKFQRNMLRLDEIENYQEFIGTDDGNLEKDTEMLYQAEPDEGVKKQWEQVARLLPNLNANQQLFIRLCIQYSFDYGRIAWHIGGISDYEVAHKVEKTLACLRAIITDSKKLDRTAKASQFRFEGDVCPEQSAILHMRYQLQYSFEDIAKALNLSQGHIQQAFATAMLKVKKVKN